MGWVHLDPESEYMQRLKPVHEAKRQLAVDFWMQWLPSTPATGIDAETVNLLRAARFTVAATLDEMLAAAPRTVSAIALKRTGRHRRASGAR